MSAPLLDNYRALLAKVDDLCARIVAARSTDIRCRPGCDGCCRNLSLFAVEAAAVGAGLRSLPLALRQRLVAQALPATAAGGCPLLVDGLCAIYPHRPIICRTHGLPILIVEEGGQRVDVCPENFRGASTLPADQLIDLERLNQVLAVVNGVFARESGGTDERVLLSDLVLACCRSDLPAA